MKLKQTFSRVSRKLKEGREERRRQLQVTAARKERVVTNLLRQLSAAEERVQSEKAQIAALKKHGLKGFFGNGNLIANELLVEKIKEKLKEAGWKEKK